MNLNKFFLIVLLVMVLTSSIVSSQSQSSIRIDGIIIQKIYDDNVEILLFNTNIFNYTYRNVYVYIALHTLREFDKQYLEPSKNLLSKYKYYLENTVFNKSLYKTLLSIVNNRLDNRLLFKTSILDSSIVLVVKNKRDLDVNKLYKIALDIRKSTNYGVKIVELSPFYGFFNGTYNGTRLANIVSNYFEKKGLSKYVYAYGLYTAFIYSIVCLDYDKVLEKANKENKTLIEEINWFIDMIRDVVPENIPLSIFVNKPMKITPITGESQSHVEEVYWPWSLLIAIITIASLTLISLIHKKIRKHT